MERLLTIQEVAEMLGVTCSTIYRLKDRQDGLRACRVGRCIRFRPEDVEDYLSRQEVKPPASREPTCKVRFQYVPGMKVV